MVRKAERRADVVAREGVVVIEEVEGVVVMEMEEEIEEGKVEGRNDRSKRRNSCVRCGRRSVERPEAWRRRERVRM